MSIDTDSFTEKSAEEPNGFMVFCRLRMLILSCTLYINMTSEAHNIDWSCCCKEHQIEIERSISPQRLQNSIKLINYFCLMSQKYFLPTYQTN